MWNVYEYIQTYLYLVLHIDMKSLYVLICVIHKSKIVVKLIIILKNYLIIFGYKFQKLKYEIMSIRSFSIYIYIYIYIYTYIYIYICYYL